MSAAALTPLEIAGGLLVGGNAVELPAPTQPPSAALVASIVPAAEHGQLYVSFSGGLDSSLVLAAAARAAASIGAAPPIPLSWIPEDAPAAREDDWQEAVVRELALPDWLRLPVGDELDWIGPVARSVIGRHGLLAPPNAHLHDPLLARAAGGTLLTGIGGDQILGTWRWGRVAALRAGSGRRTLRDRAACRLAQLPPGVLAVRERRRTELSSPWLTPGAARRVHRAALREHLSEPQRWPERVAWQAGRRGLRTGLDGLAAMATAHGAQLCHPLLEPPVLAAIAAAGGSAGFPRRSATLAACFADLLPAAVAGRRTKATFREVFDRAPSRAFVDAWDGRGTDASLIDVEALRTLWSAEVPMRTALLLQQLAITPTTTRNPPRTPAGGPEGPPASA